MLAAGIDQWPRTGDSVTPCNSFAECLTLRVSELLPAHQREGQEGAEFVVRLVRWGALCRWHPSLCS